MNKKNAMVALRVAGFGAAGLAVVSVILQLVYPKNISLPLMTVGGEEVGGKDLVVIQQQLAGFSDRAEVTLRTPSKEWKAKWATIGLAVDRTATAGSAVQYEFWERMMPFSSVIKIIQSRSQPMVTLVDQERLESFAEKIVKEDKRAAQDAAIVIKNGVAVIDEAKNGYKFSVESIASQIKRFAAQQNGRLELEPEPIAYARSGDELRGVADTANQWLNRAPVLQVAGKTYRPDKNEISKWLRFVEGANKKLQVALDRDAIKTYLEIINKDIKIDSGTVTVTLLDGQEVSRTSAPAGRSVAVDASIDALEFAVKNGPANKTIDLSIATVQPRVSYVRTYSQHSSGLQSLINDWEANNYGDYGIIVRELGGSQRYAEIQPDKPMVTASTYKMFLAYVVFTKMSRGEITAEQRTDMGWTVDECIREMIVNSTNPCAISLQNLVGWQTTDDMLQASGFSATRLNNQVGGDKYTTVRDEANFLLRLQSGTLLSAGHTDYLLSLMKRQVWRAGIPSGIPGITVANKVGLYNGWVHDVAIVYAPKGTYILAIMSKGGSDPQFADLSRRVYNFFNQ